MENKIVEEEIYQRIKKEMNKNGNWFTAEELKTVKKLLKKLT